MFMFLLICEVLSAVVFFVAERQFLGFCLYSITMYKHDASFSITTVLLMSVTATFVCSVFVMFDHSCM